MSDEQSRIFSDLYRANDSPIIYQRDRSMAAGQQPYIRSYDRMVQKAVDDSSCTTCPYVMLGVIVVVAYFLLRK